MKGVLLLATLAGVLGVATGVVLHRVLLGMLVALGVVLLGIFIAIGRTEPPDTG